MTYITLHKVNTTAQSGGSMPVVLSQPLASASAAPGGSSDPINEFDGKAIASDMIWRVAATDGAVWVKFGIGGTPVAAANTGNYVPSGQVYDFGVTQTGEIPAIIQAS